MQQNDQDDNPQGTDPGGWRSGGGTRPAHWQGETVPYGREKQPHVVAFDQRGAGRARQYGQAGVYGQRYNDQERRPPRGYARSDDSLLDDVCDALSRHRVDVSEVTVSVRDGVITLDGHVAHRNDKFELEYLAANCPGAVDVDNRLKIVTASPNADSAAPRLGE